MIRIFIVSTIFLISMLNAGVAFSKDVDTWESDKKKIENMSGESACEDRWNIIWKWAKKGNLEARYYMFVLMVPLPDMSSLCVPSYDKDSASYRRDLLIWAAYSLDFVPGDEMGDEYIKIRDSYREDTKMWIGDLGKESEKVQNLIKCIESKKNNCTEVAVEYGFVPSFKDYAKQVDALLNVGFLPTEK